jgi:hypothetical protein
VGLDRSRGDRKLANDPLEGGLSVKEISFPGNSSFGYGGLKFVHENHTRLKRRSEARGRKERINEGDSQGADQVLYEVVARMHSSPTSSTYSLNPIDVETCLYSLVLVYFPFCPIFSNYLNIYQQESIPSLSNI